ncbi:16S rRNA (cytidine(1402)-2'-O)-methyltransferase [Faecalibaculum rodentium]|uniref:Ribosomal RNA small subunit methyltransferase I n=1 Tax=Faecalibaculum rodentium TaxID=1702221 RepID=A0A1Q9YIM3_9FIRM|nr:16S rRNA (cytidine(1402)-2'-O)-methyltransferase [Faecalibaculum rodentium]OLU44154.1 16S rRNA (cytidine(1402)-2'-O)-methyltransferase [Faecalibaculum rodentium]
MNRQKSFEQDGPALLLIPSPIGNLSEVSDRVREAIESCDVIACEDTRNTGKLLSLLGFRKPLISHHEHNQSVSIPKILEELSSGHKVGVMSDAGYPVISDPGQNLVRAATEKNWPVISFSGPNAAINALVASGLDARHYLFYGFLDAKSGKRKKELEELRTVPWTLVFYEAPHRIVDTLEDMVEVFGDRPACLARELTKKFEEYLRGTLQELLSAAGDGLKGEMVLVVAGCEPEQVSTEAAITRVMALTAQGMKQKAAAKQVAAETGLSANELYRLVLQRPKPGEEDTEIPNR